MPRRLQFGAEICWNVRGSSPASDPLIEEASRLAISLADRGRVGIHGVQEQPDGRAATMQIRQRVVVGINRPASRSHSR